MCSYCGCSRARRLCAYSACYIFSWWSRPRAPLGHPLGGVQYIGAVLSCSPLIPRSAPLPDPPLLLVLFSHMRSRASRSSSRWASRHASRFVRSVAVVSSVVPSCLFVPSSRLSSRFAPFRSAVRSFSFRLSWRSCLAFSCVSFRLGISSRSSSRSSSRLAHLVSVMSSCSRSSVGGSCPFSCPFQCSRRSVLLVARSCSFIGFGFSVSVVGRGDASLGGGVCHSHLIRFISFLLATRSLRIGMRGGCGYGAPFYAARRSYLASHVPIVSPISSNIIALICPHPLIHEAGEWRMAKAKREREKRDARQDG